MPYTDRQVKEHELLARLDEIDRLQEMLNTTTDLEQAKEVCKARKKELREQLDKAL